MPISADPNATADVFLKIDKDKPLETRPAFVFRYMTRREHGKVAELVGRARATKDDAECYALLGEAICTGLVGWRHMTDADGKPLEFSLQDWDAPLSDAEIWELAHNFPSAVRLSEIDRKKSSSQSAPGGAPSAPPAVSADAPAPDPKTDPAPAA